MKTAAAWIFRITKSLSAAVGEFELVHLLPERPELYEVPRAPHFCRQVMVWQHKIVPVMDLAARFRLAAGRDTEKAPEPGANGIIGIFAYRAEETGTHEFGALSMDSIPQRCEVSDAQMCRLPAGFETWTPYVISCFQSDAVEEAIPVLSLNRLFSAYGPAPA